MLENLIVNSFDRNYDEFMLSSFSELIKQMTPIDSKILKCLKEKESLPVCKISNYISEDSCKDLAINVFVNDEFPEYNLSVSSSIDNLGRLGLVRVDYDRTLTDNSAYDVFDNLKINKDFKKDYDGKPSPLGRGFCKVLTTYEVISQTSIGFYFIESCC